MHCGSPQYVWVGEPVHELHLPQHVGLVAGHGVHLQGHHLPRHPVLHLRTKQTHPDRYPDELKTRVVYFQRNPVVVNMTLKCD